MGKKETKKRWGIERNQESKREKFRDNIFLFQVVYIFLNYFAILGFTMMIMNVFDLSYIEKNAITIAITVAKWLCDYRSNVVIVTRSKS